MVLLICNSVINFNLIESLVKDFKWSKFKDAVLWENLKTFFKSPQYVLFALLFLIYFVSFFWTNDDVNYWAVRSRLKLPFLILPVAFAGIKPFSAKGFYNLLYLFVALIVIACLVIVLRNVDMLGNMKQSYMEGRSLGFMFSHIRFSLLLAIGVTSGIFLLFKRHYIKYKWEKVLLAILTIFLIYFVHLFAVRTGILALYISLALLAFYLVLESRKYLVGLALLLAIVTGPLLAYKYVETFKQKINYTKYGLEMFKKGEDLQHYSDSKRLISIQAGIELAKEKPILGQGAGDMRPLLINYFKTNYPEFGEKWLLPHNQFVMAAAATGIVGLLILVLAVCYIVFYNKRYKNYLFAAINAIMLSSFLTEPTLETQMGTAIYIVLILTVDKYLQSKPSIKLLNKASTIEKNYSHNSNI